MNKHVPHVTIDPAAAKQARRRLIEEDQPLRDRDAPGSHDPAPREDRHEEARRKTGLGLGVANRTD